MLSSRLWLASVALSFCLAVPALADPTSCTTTCTPGAVQCDANGNVETCTVQSTVGTAGCAAAAELVYVVDENNTFSSFTPGTTPTFNDIGTLNCPDYAGGTPFSMSVDRNGTAWVLYSDGALFNVNTTTLACTATSYDSSSTGWSNFGMGFAAQTAGGSTDTLFLANTAPNKLGTLNTSSYSISALGSLTGSPELTGTGSAQLWGFFPDSSNPRVSELDQSSGAEGTSWPMSALAGSPEAWAFAFYGGDFYVFLQRTSDNSTNVWHLNGQTGAVDEALSNTGRTIVGAGESTCVPATTCYDWATTPCGTNSSCSNGQCMTSCAGACTKGATQCSATGTLQVCGFNSEIPAACPSWIDEPCSSACAGGLCLTACNPDAEIGSCPSGQVCTADQGGAYCEDAPATTATAGATAGVAASTGGATNGAGATGGGTAGSTGTTANGATNGAATTGGNGSGHGTGGATNGAGANGNGTAGSTGTSSSPTGGTSVSTGGCTSSGMDAFSALSLGLALAVRRRTRHATVSEP